MESNIETRRNIESPWRVAWRRFKKNRLALLGTVILGIFILLATFAPFLTPHDPNRSNYRQQKQPPSGEHLLGTDDMGRDVLTRTLYGGRISLTVGIVSVSISLVIGVILGAIAGAILSEASLSFLGLGVPPPSPSWGNMLNSARPLLYLRNYPWMWIPPGVAIFLSILSINFIGDGLRDALDPRQE